MPDRDNTRGRGSQLIFSPNRPVGPKLLLGALALVLGAAVGQAQPIPVPDTILLPDSLGPLYEPYHLAVGGSSGCIYVASESTDIIVVDGNTYQRIKRIETGTPVGGVCLVARHDKLYCSYPAAGRIGVIDCATNTIVGSIQVGAGPKTLCYNLSRDKLYCADTADGTVSVIECATGSVVTTVPVGTSPGLFVLDPTTDKMYVGTTDALVAIDCAADTIVARIGAVRSARALCCSRRNQKVYAIGEENLLRDTLMVLSTTADTVVARIAGIGHDLLVPSLACNDSTERVYGILYSPGGWWWILQIDGSGDSIIRYPPLGPHSGYLALVCDTVHNWIYLSRETGGKVDRVDGATLDIVSSTLVGAYPDILVMDARRSRVLCIAASPYGGTGASMSIMGGDSDSLVGAVPLHGMATNWCRDPVGEKLYYTWGDGWGGIGVIDERTNRVVAHIVPPRGAWSPVFSPASNKLYCGTGNGLVVIDCAADTVLRTLDLGDGAYDLCWLPALNRLYCYYGPDYDVAVLDCSTDSVTKTIDLRYWGLNLILAERQKMLFCFHDGGFQVVKCGEDSIVVDSLTNWNVQAFAYSPVENKLHIARVGYLNIYHVSPFYLIASMDWPFAGGGNQRLACVDSTHKLYWIANEHVGPPWGDSIKVLDTRNDSVLAVLADTLGPTDPCVDYSGRYLYLLSSRANCMLAYDTRADTLAAVLPTPSLPQRLLSSPELKRVYLTYFGSAILVYPDSVSAGIAAEPFASPKRHPSQTVQRATTADVMREGMWYDVAGRRISARDGKTAVSPGIYLTSGFGRGPMKIVVVR